MKIIQKKRKIKFHIIPKISFLVILIIIISMFFSCSKTGEGANISFDLDAEPINLDPQIASDSASLMVINNVFEGLVSIDENNNVKLSCAEKYEISEDNLTYSFKIKDDLKWSNGFVLNAEDFYFSFKRIFDDNTSSPGARIFSNIVNSDKVYLKKSDFSEIGISCDIEKNTITFNLKEPDTGFLKLLTSACAMPCDEEFFLSTKGKYGLERVSLIYNGPFKISNWLHGELVYLTKNPEYFNEMVYPDSVKLSIVPEAKKRLENFMDQESIAASLSFAEYKMVKSKKINTTVFNDTVWALGFNVKDDIFSDYNIRSILIDCIDKNCYADEMTTYFKVANSVIPEVISVSSGVVSENQNGESKKAINYSEITDNPFNYQFSPEKSKDGYFDYLINNDYDKLPKTTILVPDSDQHKFIISYIQQVWQKELGIFINLEIVPINELLDRMESGDFQMVLYPIKADYDKCESVLTSFVTNNFKNYLGYNNDDFDNMMFKALKTTDSMKQVNEYKNAENILAKDKAVVPLYFQSSIYASWDSIKDINFSPFSNQIKFTKAKKN